VSDVLLPMSGVSGEPYKVLVFVELGKDSHEKYSIDLCDNDLLSVSRRRRLDGGGARRHGQRRLRGRCQ
jgi:hypothetical protein